MGPFAKILVLIVMLRSGGLSASSAEVRDYDRLFSERVGATITAHGDGNEERVRESLRQYRRQPGLDPELFYLATRELIYFLRSPEEAQTLFKEIDVRSDDFLLRYLQAKYQKPTIRDESLDAMEGIFKESLAYPALYSTMSTIAHDLAFSLINNGHLIDAVEVLKEAIARLQDSRYDYDRIFLLEGMATAYSDRHNSDDSIQKGIGIHDELERELSRRSLEWDPTSSIFNRGIAYLFALGNFSSAIENFSRIPKGNRTYPEAQLSLALAHLGLGRTEDALHFYRKIDLANYSNDGDRLPEILCHKALIAYELKLVARIPECHAVTPKSAPDIQFIRHSIMRRPLHPDDAFMLLRLLENYYHDYLKPQVKKAMGTSVRRLELERARSELAVAEIKAEQQRKLAAYEKQLGLVKNIVIALGLLAGLALLFMVHRLRLNNARIQSLQTYIQTRVLKRFLPAALIDEILKGRSRLDEEPQARTVTILFADLVSFTAKSEALGAHKTAALLHAYFDVMSREIFACSGTIDKFIGDAIMVIFGAPQDQEPAVQADRAVRCAQAMLSALDVLNQTFQHEYGITFQMRIGINTGEAIVGSIGSENRSDYTVIGSAVNLASRIENIAEPNGIFVSASTARLMPDGLCENLGPYRLRGVTEEQNLFRVRIPDSARQAV
ncbi:MAG TPA: adenylate/guanylate cyclase domain-containing protein [Oligoflexus sp.]|uniref:adenylate/guanylate cyclase domain-containing protein n=1 Tax=Oligoflexus sp. TaxID=1971216 RepID=UPI002D7F103C|nr:adenylate/guanylate cyclase domain-containing protein [Oligoflexus sp.]HET9239916.1 adenylate/guanylate cyclase domain-containing protein [Oligoflexus sp.]